MALKPAAAAASMRPFFEPHAVAVIGATRERGRIGAEVLRNLRETGFTGTLVAVRPDAAAIDGTLAAGGGRLDVLVNNAGLQHVAPIEEFPTEKFELMLKVMVVAPFTAVKRVFPSMKRQRYGRIVNIASINGLVGFAGKAAYNTAKHGLIGFTKVAALEGAAHGITVNALCPGYVDTPLVRNQLGDLARTRNVPLERVLEEVIYPLVPMRRLLTTREIADYALFLASDRAGGVTGAAVVVDGGYTAQ